MCGVYDLFHVKIFLMTSACFHVQIVRLRTKTVSIQAPHCCFGVKFGEKFLSFYLFHCLFIYSYICLFVYLFIWLFACLFIYSFIRLFFFNQSVRQFIHPSIPSINQSSKYLIFLFIHLSFTYSLTYLFVELFVSSYFSLYLLIYLSASLSAYMFPSFFLY